ncbi:hypothetical protein B0A55_00756 [Friedmanniomyces simplex]|uniref:Uncharacterized protein n=1 Tax=Friedmanniomyces simplex TaxID=329884 RepID=A0A4U0Y0Q7_9PEZI|nr:hypothetical protein B0A55_00756 [Friedmanniomyces simplex]
MAAADPGPPPDFELLAQSCITMAENFSRFRNLPAVDNGVAIMEAIQTLNNRMEQMQQQMQQMHQQTQQQLLGMEERLGMRISASNTNSLSRLQNSQLIAPDNALAPLYHHMTNTPIDDFPATPAGIANLSAASATALLTALGENVAGTLLAKRQRIRHAIGLKQAAV